MVYDRSVELLHDGLGVCNGILGSLTGSVVAHLVVAPDPQRDVVWNLDAVVNAVL